MIFFRIFVSFGIVVLAARQRERERERLVGDFQGRVELWHLPVRHFVGSVTVLGLVVEHQTVSTRVETSRTFAARIQQANVELFAVVRRIPRFRVPIEIGFGRFGWTTESVVHSVRLSLFRRAGTVETPVAVTVHFVEGQRVRTFVQERFAVHTLPELGAFGFVLEIAVQTVDV
jgi:hypothetical protein